ncbi:uncharacterized protein LOC121376949 [Gigantopelta aegis]|uniref:uncharacterized protein LOC121376949 n=1 Tax=Gigantopelta aegis TaxID=1735272 RepID=UPI001B887879|nr:uncharacterized protein LOC121376949 [Gigantopelta aegis]
MSKEDEYSSSKQNGSAGQKSKSVAETQSSIVMLMQEDHVSKNGLNITCYIGDVTEAEAEGIVTGQGRDMTDVSMVTRRLFKRGRIDCKQLGTLVTNKYGTADVESGEVYCLDTKICGMSLRFKVIFLAILSPVSPENAQSDWKIQLERLYVKVLEDADRQGIATLAVPLLGSGKAGAPMKLAVRILVDSLFSHKSSRLKRVFLVSFDYDVHVEIVKRCNEYPRTEYIPFFRQVTNLFGFGRDLKQDVLQKKVDDKDTNIRETKPPQRTMEAPLQMLNQLDLSQDAPVGSAYQRTRQQCNRNDLEYSLGQLRPTGVSSDLYKYHQRYRGYQKQCLVNYETPDSFREDLKQRIGSYGIPVLPSNEAKMSQVNQSSEMATAGNRTSDEKEQLKRPIRDAWSEQFDKVVDKKIEIHYPQAESKSSELIDDKKVQSRYPWENEAVDDNTAKKYGRRKSEGILSRRLFRQSSEKPLSTRSADITSSDCDDSRPVATHVLRNGLQLKVHLMDILKVKAQVIVTGESSDLSGISLITQLLCKHGGMEHQEWREKLLSRHENLKAGQVCEMRMHTELPFVYSFSAIMSQYLAESEVEWKKQMTEIYVNIVRKADEMRTRAVVMPLLGSGRAGAPVELAIDVLLNSMSAEPRDYFEEVHLAVVEKKIYDKVVKECQNLNSKPAPEPKEAWVSSSRVSDWVADPRRPQQVDSDHLIPVRVENPKKETGFDDIIRHKEAVVFDGNDVCDGDDSDQSSAPTGQETRSDEISRPRKAVVDDDDDDDDDDSDQVLYRGDQRFTPSDITSRRNRSELSHFSSRKSKRFLDDGDVVRRRRQEEVLSSQQSSLRRSMSVRELHGQRWNRNRFDELHMHGQNIKHNPLPTKEQTSRKTAFAARMNDLSTMKKPVPELNTIGRDSSSHRLFQMKKEMPTGSPATKSPEVQNSESFLRRHLYRDQYSKFKHEQRASELDTSGRGSDRSSTQMKKQQVSTGSPPVSRYHATSDICVICIDIASKPKILDKCGHVFCCGCIDKCFQVFKPVCPICNTIYGVIIGNQPQGNMTVKRERNHSLPGHPDCGTISITYHFKDGTQGSEHPNPGSRYHGTTRTAYLPDSPEGNKVLCLLQIAFERRVTFAIGMSLTTGKEDVITWNDIHHKTRRDGNAKGFGYPDPTYLSRVVEELKCKGITEDDM